MVALELLLPAVLHKWAIACHWPAQAKAKGAAQHIADAWAQCSGHLGSRSVCQNDTVDVACCASSGARTPMLLMLPNIS
jgi:hypothetical protein